MVCVGGCFSAVVVVEGCFSAGVGAPKHSSTSYMHEGRAGKNGKKDQLISKSSKIERYKACDKDCDKACKVPSNAVFSGESAGTYFGANAGELRTPEENERQRASEKPHAWSKQPT